MANNNSDIIILIISAAVVLLLLLIFIISFLFIYKSRQVKNAAELKSLSEKYKQEILQAQLEIREQTLKNISEEIHDNVGQVLSLVVLNLSSIEPDDWDCATEKLTVTTDLVKRALADLRNLSKSLDAENVLQIGLSAMIHHELEILNKTGRFHTAFDTRGQEVRLEPSREIVTYRIVQESINNVIKHARASELKVSVEYGEKDIHIGIADNGIGFDKLQLTSSQKTGAGLKNMVNRARLIGAELRIDSRKAQGTVISFRIPIGDTRSLVNYT